MRAKTFGWILTLGVLIFSQAALSQSASQSASHGGTLSVSGHAGQVPVAHLHGKSYVEVEALARLVNGSVSFNGNRTTLTIPSGAAAASSSGLSRAFVNAAIEQLGAIREWRSALSYTVQNSYPVTPGFMTKYGGAAESGLRLASAAATTDSDKKALQLLTNEYNNMHQSADRFQQARQTLTAIPQDSLDNDPLDQKIVACGHALAAMATSGEYQDAASCH